MPVPMGRLLVICPRMSMLLMRLQAGCCGRPMSTGIGPRELQARRGCMPASCMCRWRHWKKPAVLRRITNAVHSAAASWHSMPPTASKSGRRTSFPNNRKSPAKTKKACGSGGHRELVSGQHQLSTPITDSFTSRRAITILFRRQGPAMPLSRSIWNRGKCAGYGS